MRTLAIIPARGGSKRIPGKNLCVVGGRALWRRAVDSALPCTQIALSTDLDVSTGLALDIGFMVHHRRPEHATDEAQIETAMRDVLRGVACDVVVLLQPTSPFRTAAHVRAALEMLTPGVDSVVSVVQDPGFRFMGRLATNGEYRPYRTDLGERGRSTDALDHRCPVRENGAIYVTRREAFERSGLRMSGVMRALVMSERDSFEIDEPWQLEAARAMAGCV